MCNWACASTEILLFEIVLAVFGTYILDMNLG